MHLVKNDTAARIAKEREAQRTEQPLTKNYIYLFIDSLSRADFYRKLPETKEWMESLYDNPDSVTNAYQFFRYNAMSHYTEDNIIPATFGKQKQYTATNNEHISFDFESQGFVNGFSSTDCSGREFPVSEDDDYYQNLKWANYANENWALNCDPSFVKVGAEYSNFQGKNSMIRRCFYGKDINWWAFEYANQFWDAYANNSKFF